MPREWYLQSAKGVIGPLRTKVISEMAKEGRLLPTDRIRLGSDGKWIEVIKFKGLKIPDKSGKTKPIIKQAIGIPVVAKKHSSPVRRRGRKTKKRIILVSVFALLSGIVVIAVAKFAWTDTQLSKNGFVEPIGPNERPEVPIPPHTIDTDRDYDTYVTLGLASDMAGKYVDAIKNFSEAIRLDPINASAYVGRGTTFGAKGDYLASIKDFDEAIRLDPENAGAYIGRGFTWGYIALASGKSADHAAAIKDYSEGIRLDPKRHDAYQFRGGSYFLTGQYDSAIKDFDKMIEFEPENFLGFEVRGAALKMKFEFDAAIKDLNEAVRLNPNSVQALVHRGICFWGKGQLNTAKQDFTKAIQLAPGNIEIRQLLRDLDVKLRNQNN